MILDNINARIFADKLTEVQKTSIQAIIDQCTAQGITDQRQIAYILATAYHECFNPRHPETRMTPITEFGGEVYLKGKKYYPYYGRGFSQLTWEDNYKKEGLRMGLDLIGSPVLMLQIPTAANSHVYCMVHGSYTGRKLSDYINEVKCDFVNARRIVNGTDKADVIAGYAQKFLAAIQAT